MNESGPMSPGSKTIVSSNKAMTNDGEMSRNFSIAHKFVVNLADSEVGRLVVVEEMSGLEWRNSASRLLRGSLAGRISGSVFKD